MGQRQNQYRLVILDGVGPLGPFLDDACPATGPVSLESTGELALVGGFDSLARRQNNGAIQVHLITSVDWLYAVDACRCLESGLVHVTFNYFPQAPESIGQTC